eukprot:COSAG06_NODE_3070_length_5880_cov_2.562802_4_plen_37_part_00
MMGKKKKQQAAETEELQGMVAISSAYAASILLGSRW